MCIRGPFPQEDAGLSGTLMPMMSYISIMKVKFLEVLYSEKCTETMLKSLLYALKNSIFSPRRS